MSEFYASVADFARESRAWQEIKSITPDGSGDTPVLLIPGMMAHDITTLRLRSRLEDKGYVCYGWEAGVNLGLTDEKKARLPEHLKKIFKRHDGQKVRLLGHSLGGPYAQELAREFPEMAHCNVSLGSPKRVDDPGAIFPPLHSLHDCLNPDMAAQVKTGELSRRLSTPVPDLPSTMIYSETDPIVHWKSSLYPSGDLVENIKVRSSHIGLIWNHEALTAVLDRFAQPEHPKDWQPFERAQYPTIFDPHVLDNQHLPPHPGHGHTHKPYFSSKRKI